MADFAERFQPFAQPTNQPVPFGAAVQNPGGPTPEPTTAEQTLANDNQALGLSQGGQIAKQALASSELATQRMEAILGQRAELARQKSEAMEPRYKALERELGQGIPQPPRERPIPKAPTREDAAASDGQQMWLTAAMFLGVLGGALTRRPLTNALSAFTGIVEGQHQAHEENYEKLTKDWERANKEALEANAQTEREYERIMKNRSLSIEQKKVLLQLTAMRYDDQGMALAAQMQGEEQIAKLNDQRAKYAEQLDKAQKTAQEEAWQRRADAWIASPAGQARIKAILEYREPLPTNLARSGYNGILNNAIVDAVNTQGGGTYDQKQYQVKQSAERMWATVDPKVSFATERAFAVGPEARSTRSLNVAVDHLHFLDDKLIPALRNGEFNKINEWKQYIQKELGARAPTDFEAARQIVGAEIIKAINQNGGGVVERQEAQSFLDKARSPEQLHGLVQVYERLMAGQLHGLEQQYQFGGGRKDFRNALRPETQQALSKDFDNLNAPPEMQDHIQRLAENMERLATGVATPIAGAAANVTGTPQAAPRGTPTSQIPGYSRGRGLPAGWIITPQ